MEHCQYEHEIKRIIKILDGNARGGLVRDVIEIRKEQSDMCVSISDLKETSQLQATAINGFVRYQAETQALEDYKKEQDKIRRQEVIEQKKMRRQMFVSMITTAVAVAGLIIKLIIG